MHSLIISYIEQKQMAQSPVKYNTNGGVTLFIIYINKKHKGVYKLQEHINIDCANSTQYMLSYWFLGNKLWEEINSHGSWHVSGKVTKIQCIRILDLCNDKIFQRRDPCFGWLISRINVFSNLLDSRMTLSHPFVFGLMLSVNLVVSITYCFLF